MKSNELDPWFLDLLVCPLTKAPVVQVGDWLYSTDRNDPRRYPVRDGIPNMLPEESEVISPEEQARALAQAEQEKAADGYS